MAETGRDLGELASLTKRLIRRLIAQARSILAATHRTWRLASRKMVRRLSVMLARSGYSGLVTRLGRLSAHGHTSVGLVERVVGMHLEGRKRTLESTKELMQWVNEFIRDEFGDGPKEQ